jgi:DNA-binding transcriptional regulator YiaG
MKGELAMANLGKVLKSEIARISRKEIKTAIGEIGKSHTGLKKIVTDLKKRVASLEKENKRLAADSRKRQAEHPEKRHEEGGKARLTSKGVRSLRSRLGLTQADFAKLLGATTHSVHLWEKKEGPLRLRDNTRVALLSIRRLGAREARAKLDEIKGMREKDRSSASRYKRRS